MKARITKRVDDETSATGRPAFVFDTDLAGFVLKVLPTGRKVYQLRYRMGGRQAAVRTYTIGTHGPLTPEQARRQAQILIGDVRRGVDPAAEKARRIAEDHGAATVETIARDFMELQVKAKQKSRTAQEYDKLLRRLVLPAFGSRALKEIIAGDIERWYHSHRATPYQANRALAFLSSLMTWATSRGFRSGENPCRIIARFKEAPRKRYLSSDEIARLGDALRICEVECTITPHVAAFFRIALLSGLRKDELRLATWDRIDFRRRVLVLGEADSKSGQRDVPLSAPVLQILTQLPRLEENVHVFVGRRKGQPIVNVSKPWKMLLAVANIDGARPHDLRHTAASIGVATGASLLLIGGVLGHRSPQTTSRYTHLTDDPVRATSEAIGQRVAKALGGESGMVVPLGRQGSEMSDVLGTHPSPSHIPDVLEYSAPISFDGGRFDEEPQGRMPPDYSTDDWIDHLRWRIDRVEKHSESRFEHDKATRVAIAIVLDRQDWLREVGADHICEALSCLTRPCIEAMSAIYNQRGEEDTRFAPVFACHGIPDIFRRQIIKNLLAARHLGALLRRPELMRSQDSRERQERELAALEKVKQHILNAEATDRFRQACAGHGITQESVHATIGQLKFWLERESPRTNGSANTGLVAHLDRTMAVWCLADVWEALDHAANASYSQARGDRRTAFVRFVEDCAHALGAEEWFAGRSLGRSIANDLEQRKAWHAANPR